MNMTSEKKDFLKDQTERLLQSWVGISAILGAVLFLSLVLLDYFVTPANFIRFLIYRLIAVTFLLLIYFLNKLRRNIQYQYILVISGIIISAVTIELMILHLGGHESFYYAGINLLIVCVLGVLPLNLPVSLSVSLLLYSIYLIPILVYDTITDSSIFINNNVFIIATIGVAFAWRILSQKSITGEFELQYDLDQERKKLANYSSHLEDVVKERTRELRKSETLLKTLYENANDGIVITDKFGLIINTNNQAAEMHGFEKDQLAGMNIELLELKKNQEIWRERMGRLLNGEALIFETEHYKRDGSTIFLEISSKAVEIEGEMVIQSILRDITEKKKLHHQLLHSQKMESIGTLAGGIAHDFNNILTSILGFTDLIIESDKPSNDVVSKLRVVESSARKGTAMISKLLSFARKGSIEAVPFMVNPVIEGTLEMLSRLIPKDIAIKRQLNNKIPAAKGDVNQIEQVLMNLIINARDAMPEGGEISISTDAVELGAGDLDIGIDVRKGRYVRMTLNDTGKGIPREHLDRIFEPFFTTKEAGKGTGLGLAMVYGIIKEHGGYITVDSRAGRGTAFDIYLPATDMLVAAREHEVRPTKGVAANKILVIDDEIPVLELIKQTLLNNGFDVIVFNNPLQGLEYFKSNTSRVELVITDMVMPSMGGAQLINSVRELNPDVKIIAITGFAEALAGAEIDGFLKKPFQRSRLLSEVNKILN